MMWPQWEWDKRGSLQKKHKTNKKAACHYHKTRGLWARWAPTPTYASCIQKYKTYHREMIKSLFCWTVFWNFCSFCLRSFSHFVRNIFWGGGEDFKVWHFLLAFFKNIAQKFFMGIFLGDFFSDFFLSDISNCCFFPRFDCHWFHTEFGVALLRMSRMRFSEFQWRR